MQEAVGGYFRDPNGTASKKGSTNAGAGENFILTKDDMPKLKDQLEQKIRQMQDFEKLKSHVEMTVTSEGLRIELTESASGTFFDSGSQQTECVTGAICWSLSRRNLASYRTSSPSKAIPIPSPMPLPGTYSNWELSSDRANAARRLMQTDGVGPDQVTQVRGFADQRLRKPDNPLDPSNRRISTHRAIHHEG